MPIDVAVSLRHHYLTFLAVLVTGVVLILVCDGASRSTAVYVDCALGVASLLGAYALAPAPPPDRPRR
ncbi:hypothetical protein [Streptomyces griseiscabiei]|uniref:Integral membrane protein n=1 Tax=Streptomyces griseiscabiei TaxID=2993540 RepID=A0ABU4LFY0_9ACTN|nr:hypothetical protein [Streptomyces griseiscabiei]MBZ3907174.1 hypothetical protein [Streptomyces griseiscabiei]MDX2914326.1 hypothetical protein [Streptomyces griseiscabiei]